MSEKRKVTKAERIQVVLEQLIRWGKLDKEEIVKKVANKTHDNADDLNFERAIYRDLEDLVTSGRVKADFFNRDGTPIEDFDEDKHKNYFCKWYVPSEEGSITGASNLVKQNGFLLVPAGLKTECSIGSGVSPDPKSRNFYFHAGNVFFCFKANLEARVFSVAISRTHGEIKTDELNEVYKKIGKKTFLLKLPDAKLSSFKPNQRLAHASIKVMDDSEIEIEDFGSTNGLNVYKLTMTEADDLRCKGEDINLKTMTSSWMSTSSFQATPTKVSGKLKMKCPVLIEFGETYHILVL
jgi:hypothetical protein